MSININKLPNETNNIAELVSKENKNEPTQTDLSNYFDIKFYNEKHGSPLITPEFPEYKYVNVYSEYHCITKKALINILTNQDNSKQLHELQKKIDTNKNELCHEIIMNLMNIIYAQNFVLQKNNVI